MKTIKINLKNLCATNGIYLKKFVGYIHFYTDGKNEYYDLVKFDLNHDFIFAHNNEEFVVYENEEDVALESIDGHRLLYLTKEEYSIINNDTIMDESLFEKAKRINNGTLCLRIVSRADRPLTDEETIEILEYFSKTLSYEGLEPEDLKDKMYAINYLLKKYK